MSGSGSRGSRGKHLAASLLCGLLFSQSACSDLESDLLEENQRNDGGSNQDASVEGVLERPADFSYVGPCTESLQFQAPQGTGGLTFEGASFNRNTRLFYFRGDSWIAVPINSNYVPSPPNAEILPADLAGRWRIQTTCGSFASQLSLRVRFQVLHQEATPNVLDLVVYLPEGLREPTNQEVLTPTTVMDSAVSQERIDLFFEELREAFGIARGRVEFEAVPSRLLNFQYTDFGSNLSERADSRSLVARVLWAAKLDDGPPLLGLSLEPGRIADGGGGNSFLALGLNPDSSVREQAHAMLHELGHFAGLEHTSQLSQSSDQLSDTPAGPVSCFVTDCADGSYVMFPATTDRIRQTTTSPSQRRILQGTLLHHPMVERETFPGFVGAPFRWLEQPASQRAEAPHRVARMRSMERDGQRFVVCED